MRYAFQSVALLLAVVCTNANAFDNQKIANIAQAADSFVALAGNSAHTGKPPRESDPAAKRLLDVVLDTTEIEKGAVYSRSELGNLSTWIFAVVKVGTVYTLSGSGIGDINSIPNDPDLMKKLNNNAVLFAPEMGRYYDALMYLEGATADTTAVVLSAASPSELDRIKNGVALIRSGLTQSLNGVITTLPTAGIADAWRRARLATVLTIAPKAAKLLLPEQLAQLRQVASTVAAQMTDPGVKAALSSFVEKLTPR